MNLALSVPRPAQAALLPGIVRTPLELTAGNVVSTWMENVSVFLAPALTGVILGIGGPGLATGGACGSTPGGRLSLVVGIPGPRPITERVEGVVADGRGARRASPPSGACRRRARWSE